MRLASFHDYFFCIVVWVSAFTLVVDRFDTPRVFVDIGMSLCLKAESDMISR